MEPKSTKPEVAKPKIENWNHGNTNQPTQQDQNGQTPKVLQTQPIDHGEEGIPFMRVDASHGQGHGDIYSEK